MYAALTCARARLQDGQAILELGCGWGSLTLFMAQAYRNSSITAVSNSNTQREFIMRRARDLGLTNVQVLTADMVDFQVGLWVCVRERERQSTAGKEAWCVQGHMRASLRAVKGMGC